MNPSEINLIRQLRGAMESALTGSLRDADEALSGIDPAECQPLADLRATLAQLVKQFATSLTGKETALATLQLSLLELEAARDALRESEEKHRVLYESSRDAIMIVAPPTWRFESGNPAAIMMFRAGDEAEFVKCGPWDVSPERQPNGRSSAEMAQEAIARTVRDGSHIFEWTHRRLDGTDFPATVLLTRAELQGRTLVQATVRDVTEQKQAENALRVAHRDLQDVFQASPVAIVTLDRDLLVRQWNPAAEQIFGWTAAEVLGRPCPTIPEADRASAGALMAGVMRGRAISTMESRRVRKDGVEVHTLYSIAPLRDSAGDVTAIVGVMVDMTERKRLESQLAQAQKLESIGQLAAGIAHEINTPTQYVGDNTRFLRTSFADLIGVISRCAALLAATGKGELTPELIERTETAFREADIDFLAREIPAAIDQTLEGVEQVSRIVRAMKDFSHPDSDEKGLADLNKAIDSALIVCRSEWKYVAEMVMDFDPDLPLVPCLVGNFNQVILNLVTNAAHAIRDVVGENGPDRGTISVSTRRDGQWAEVRIRDTGAGISEAIRSRIFDPFFTTKGVGKGTGQGLAISHQVIVKKHGGSIDFESEVGVGTTFILRLPLKEELPPQSRAA